MTRIRWYAQPENVENFRVLLTYFELWRKSENVFETMNIVEAYNNEYRNVANVQPMTKSALIKTMRHVVNDRARNPW